MKIAIVLLALFNSVVAGLILVFSLSPGEIQQAAPLWTIAKASAAVLVIVISALTWFSEKRRFDPGLMYFCSILLVGLGAAAILTTIRLSMVTGDLENYMLVYGGSLLLQAALSFWDQRQHSHQMSLS